MKPYVFAHRGASGYEIENTIPSFKKAVSMGVGIETDIQITKDNKLICFHDPYVKIGTGYNAISDLTFKDIQGIQFKDRRKIPLVEEVFQIFKNSSYDLRYSFDISNKQVGLELLNLAEKYSLLNQIEITDRRLITLSLLRKQNNDVKLIYTSTDIINTFRDNALNVDKLRKINVCGINLKCSGYIKDLFKMVIDNDFKCYIWGVNTKTNMQKVLNLGYKGQIVQAIYTDYPDTLLNLIMEHFK
ncbi:MAG: glycerophosphodiester phosphodiesterase [Promethearchaeota archaeon]